MLSRLGLGVGVEILEDGHVGMRAIDCSTEKWTCEQPASASATVSS